MVVRDPYTKYVLSMSYGKDSIACIEAIMQLGYPLDEIAHAEIWATDDLPAELPEMVAWKQEADKIIYDRYGYKVKHYYPMRNGEKLTYEKIFHEYRVNKETGEVRYFGFPTIKLRWCAQMKKDALAAVTKIPKGRAGWYTKRIVQYLGIAADEPSRIVRHESKPNVVLPLVDIGWDEAYCRKWCEENNLLSPIYQNHARGGCWFCQFQPTESLRDVRDNYPDLWKIMLEWDLESPLAFNPHGHTVHDYEKRFQMEDEGKLDPKKRFVWKDVKEERPTGL